MEELGILVDENGRYMSFGTWVSYEKKDLDNPEHWHGTIFNKKVYPTSWFKNQNLPYSKDIEWQRQLNVFAENGKIIINNNKMYTGDINTIKLSMCIPNTLTIGQILFLLKREREFKEHTKDGFCCIDVLEVNEDFNIINTFYDIDKFYTYVKKYLLESLSKENKQKVKKFNR